MDSPLLNYNELKKKRDAVLSAVKEKADARAQELIKITLRMADEHIATLQVTQDGRWYVPVDFDLGGESVEVQACFEDGMRAHGFVYHQAFCEQVGYNDRTNRFIVLAPLNVQNFGPM